MEKVKAYHFLRNDMTECECCGDEPPWKVGEKRVVKGKLEMCVRGYHASPSWYNALSYARGCMACVVELSGEVQKDTDKYVARTRKLIVAKDAERVIRIWTCDCAKRAIEMSKTKERSFWDAIRELPFYYEARSTTRELFSVQDANLVAWAALYVAGDCAFGSESAEWDAEITLQERSLNKLMTQLFKEESNGDK